MEPPVKPHDSDCCNSACNPCILDIYEQQLRKYNEFLKNPIKINQQQINCIDQIVYKKFQLIERIPHTTDTYFFRFVYCDDNVDGAKQPNGLYYKWGQYFLMKSPSRFDEFTRPYTPIPYHNADKIDGYNFTILVRLYEYGRMSKYLQRLQINDITWWRGPYGDFQLDHNRSQLFVAQGVGIAPIYAIIQQLLDDENYEKRIKLLYCCRNCDEIILRHELLEFSRFWNFNCEIFVKNLDNFNENYYETIHKHKLRIDDLRNTLVDYNGAQINICGNESFEQSLKQSIIKECCVDEHDIYLF